MIRHLASACFALALGLQSTLLVAAPVPTESGPIAGTADGDLAVYKGIPYAAPPVGPLRWRAPQPAPKWQGVRQASAYSPACPQVGNYPDDAKQQPTSEDCLTLNIWAPVTNGKGKLPVMVWIHGGGLVNGSGSVPNYAGDRLAKRGVIVVTLNYRLGALGFLSHPELDKESPRGLSGNYGLLDQIAALQWIKRNIASFGGDPDQVTIFGQSSGAFSVSMLTASPLAKGLFRRAIAQSGGVFEPVELDPNFSREGAAEVGAWFTKKAGAKSIAELRKLPAEALLKVPYSPQFIIDGYALPQSPFDAYKAGKQNAVDLLLGNTASEGTYFVDPKSVTVANFESVLSRTFPGFLLTAIGADPGKTDAEARKAAVAIDTDLRFRWDMWNWARMASQGQANGTYLYSFNGQPAYRTGHPLKRLGAVHGGELPFVFGQLDPNAADWTAADARLSDTIQQYWTNFAKTGDPNAPGLARWDKFDSDRSMAMELGANPRMLAIVDESRLERISTVYSIARFVSGHVYGIIAAIALLVIGFIALLARFILRRRKKRAAARTT